MYKVSYPLLTCLLAVLVSYFMSVFGVGGCCHGDLIQVVCVNCQGQKCLLKEPKQMLKDVSFLDTCHCVLKCSILRI